MTKSLRVAAKAAETSAARLCAAAVEASQPHPADTDVSAGWGWEASAAAAHKRAAEVFVTLAATRNDFVIAKHLLE